MTLDIVARGKQAKYDTLRMTLDGRIERPKLDLLLDRPNEALDVRAMRLQLDPTATGFNYRATGGSRLGHFTSYGRILLPKGGRTVIAVAELNVAGST